MRNPCEEHFGVKANDYCIICLIEENERLRKEVEGAKIIIKVYLRNNRTGRTPIEYIEALNWVRATR